jgi:hypothetical protein
MGNSLEATRYFAIIDNASTGSRMLRVKRKRKHTKTGTILVEEISYSDYCAGLITQVVLSYLEEAENTLEPLYLKYFND